MNAIRVNRMGNGGNRRIWNILIGQIIKGNVIPVIGGEMTYINNDKSPLNILLDEIKDSYNLTENVSSFTALMNRLGIHTGDVYYDVADMIEDNKQLFAPTELLKDFLSIKYFPFIITTTIYPTIENTMREIHGDHLRVLIFCNDSSNNDDIEDSKDTMRPTLYYMFGKANDRGKDFVLSDTDLLQFSRSWLQPTDSDNKSKPANLSNALSNKFLLVLGNNFQDWLFRFFWLAMKNNNVFTNKGKIPNGLEASEHSDEQLIEFLSSSNIMSQISNLSDFVNELKFRLKQKQDELKNNPNLWFDEPTVNADVFISYSRADSEIVEQLYNILVSKGLVVWYDKKNLGAGTNFIREIREAIRGCKLFIPILTENIRKQAAESHVYRNEWKFALEQEEQISPAIPYIIPLCEKSFDMNDNIAGVQDGIKVHNAELYSKENPGSELEEFANKICDKLRERLNIINAIKKDQDESKA